MVMKNRWIYEEIKNCEDNKIMHLSGQRRTGKLHYNKNVIQNPDTLVSGLGVTTSGKGDNKCTTQILTANISYNII